MFQPIYDRVLLKPDEHEEKSPGGIFIPQVANDRMTRCTVLAIGPGRRNENGVLIPVSVAVGDRVIIGQHTGHDIEVDGEKLYMVRDTEIMGILGGQDEI